MIRLLLLPAFAAAQSQGGQVPAIVQSQGDVVSMHTLVDSIRADPENPNPRKLLQRLIQEKLILRYDEVRRQKAAALELALRVSQGLGASAETEMRLMQALNAADPLAFQRLALRRPAADAGSKTPPVPPAATPPAATPPDAAQPEPPISARESKSQEDTVTVLLKEAAEHYQEGRKDHGLASLVAALALKPNLLITTVRPPAAPAQGAESAPRPPSANPPQREAPPRVQEQAKPAPSAPMKSPVAVSAKEKKAAQYHFSAGIRAYGVGRLEEAIQAFRESLTHDPNNEWVRNSLDRAEDERALQAAARGATPALTPAERRLLEDAAGNGWAKYERAKQEGASLAERERLLSELWRLFQGDKAFGERIRSELLKVRRARGL